jgi:hypothetical protein
MLTVMPLSWQEVPLPKWHDLVKSFPWQSKLTCLAQCQLWFSIKQTVKDWDAKHVSNKNVR